jgi:hypothetical protein
MSKTTYDRVVERIASIVNKEGLPKKEYDKALGIKK